MSRLLIDTNVISEIARPKPNADVVAFLSNLASPYLSIVTIHELAFGIACLEAGSQRHKSLQSVIDEFLDTFGSNILPATEPIARAAGALRATAQKAGHTAGLADALIAATALVHGLSVATRNVADFDRLGVPTINPWE